MSQNIHPFSEQFVSLAGELAELFSFNRSVGQIFGLLYLSPEPVSLEEIALSCRMSKGNASIHLRTLENWGAVRCSWKPGTRKDYFEAVSDLRELATRRLQEGLSRRLKMTRESLEAMKSNPALQQAFQSDKGGHWKKRLGEVEK